MVKWADYLIGAVHYNETKNNKKYIAKVLVFDNANGDNSVIGRAGEDWQREKVISSIDNNKTFCTVIRKKDGNYGQGADVKKYKIKGNDYIKTKKNEVDEDNLGELPEY